MLLRYVQRLDVLRQMQLYLDDRAEALRGYDSGGGRRSLDEVTRRLGELHIAQETHGVRSKGERRNEQVLADRLRYKYILPIIATAALDDDRLAPLRPIRFPHRRRNTTALVLDARAVIAVVTPLATVIESYGLRPGFLEAFKAATARLERATKAKNTSRTTRVGATAGIEQVIKHARLCVSAMNALVLARLPEGSPLETEWKGLVRAFRSAGRKRAGKRGDNGAR